MKNSVRARRSNNYGYRHDVYKATSSIATIRSKTLGNRCKSEIRQYVTKEHDTLKTKELTVQSKVHEIAELENSNRVWKKFTQGFLAV